MELRLRYDDFFRVERFNYPERIAAAIDDSIHRSRSNSSKFANATSSLTTPDHPRFRIPLTELRSFDPRLVNSLIRDPLRHLRALEASAHDVAMEERPGYDKHDVKVKVALGGPVASRPMSPRELASGSLRRLVCVEGVAVKVSSIKPKLVKSVHYCPQTNTHESRTYVDATDPQLGLPALDSTGNELPDKRVTITSTAYPTKDKDGNPLETEFGLSVFKDYQTVTLQEMPEKAPMGQLPRSVEMILEHDLVDRMKPGDRVQITGVFRALATASSGQTSTSGVFKTVVLVNDVKILGRDSSGLIFDTEDIRMIRSLGKRNDILDILGRSICPSIHGHDVIKKALALQLLSGCEKNLKNGTHLRGDINILMVGDPSTAKSQLLRAAMSISPLAISTTGKGSSGVGLTAAVTSDPETKERRLEAGAMVLADRGLVCVDEFDKMGENDRVAIHEAMEQQTVTIAKAGLHASLNARCSVLAAANPVYGQYDRKRRIQENIGLPDSLLSRFDLLFVVLDQLDPDSDRRIAAHVIRGHRYLSVGGSAGHDSDYDDDSSEDENEDSANNATSKAHSIWQRSRYDFANSSRVRAGREDDDPHSDDVLQHDFLRKYLHFAKHKFTPRLTDEARECIAGRYAEMRSRQDERTLPVTARSLETIIRLASAHAKARLSNEVDADTDVAAAMDILSFALYHENTQVLEDTSLSKDKRKVDELSNTDEEASDSEDNSPKRPRAEDDLQDGATSSNTSDALSKLTARVFEEVDTSLDDGIEIVEVCDDITDRELIARVARTLHEDGKIYMADDMLYRV